ncbi:MAG TPA: anion transporter [Anaerolineaceae bacterium]|nr:anion transporter [Anaerolineaceae bacterium]
MLPNPWITLAVVVVTFIGIALGRYPIIKSNRTTIALMGVALLLALRQVRFDDLPSYLDFDTLILLFSMMIINANLKLAGFFTLAGRLMVRFARTPRLFLALEIVVMGLLSALFLNDTICLMFAPFIINLLDDLKRNPLPYLIALATATNIGSTATLTGNPQNMIVGIASGIPYLDFALALTPVALLSMGIIWVVLVRFYPYELRRGERFNPPEREAQPISRPLLIKTLAVTLGLLVAFLAGAPIALASFIAANILLITRRHQPQTVFAEFDWSLLVFFAALFIVSGSLETSGVTRSLVHLDQIARGANVVNLTVITTVLSNLISNVPAVLLLRPIAASMANARLGWLTIAAASTLAGNLTLLGSVANLIVAESASRYRIELSFWEYTKSGLIITLFSLLVAVLWLSWVVA